MIVVSDSKIKHSFYGGLSALPSLFKVPGNILCIEEPQTGKE